MSVDALRVWEQLEEECCEAVNYYSREYSSISPDKKRIKVILEQGAADFDQKYCPDDMGEKEHYRADYYVHGYMGMHLKQNFAALKYCFKDRIRQPLLFVDFGCGPMTSGLALAQVLSNGYKAETSYFGIDASRHMVKKAKYINEKYKLFSPECFKVVQGTQFDPQKIWTSFPEPQNCGALSFVCRWHRIHFARLDGRKTLLRKLADDLERICCQSNRNVVRRLGSFT